MKTRTCVVLINKINESTAPYIPRTDHAHKRHALRARLARRDLQRRYVYGRDYTEFESGLLFPREFFA